MSIHDFLPTLYDRAHVPDPNPQVSQFGVDFVGMFINELVSHELFDHGNAKRGENLPPMQNFEQLGVRSQVNTSDDMYRLAAEQGGLT